MFAQSCQSDSSLPAFYLCEEATESFPALCLSSLFLLFVALFPPAVQIKERGSTRESLSPDSDILAAILAECIYPEI